MALNRKNALFAGSDGGAGHWATVASLIETCKLNDVDPLGYRTDVLTRIVNGHLDRDIDQLLPWAIERKTPKPWPENDAYDKFGDPDAAQSNIDCRLVWLDPRPLEEDIYQAYATYYLRFAEEKQEHSGPYFVSELRMLARSVVLVGGLKKQKQDVSDMHLNELQPGRLLDIGCGDGRFLHRMKSRSWSVVGLDFDVQAARAAKEKR